VPVAYIEEIGRHEGEEVTVRGWLYNLRLGGKIAFLLIRDGTGTIQAVASRAEIGDERFQQIATLTQESSLCVSGAVRKDARAPGGYEMSVRDLAIGQVAESYPITPKEHGTAFLMEHRHLWLRSSRQHAVLRVRATLVSALREFLDARGFLLVDAPIFTPAACEGTSTLFETAYFDDKAYLTQSGQLYNEAAAMAFGKVYCFGPTFRAEKSKTRRHLMEFWMLEPEIAYATLDDVMALEEEMLEAVVARVLRDRLPELEMLERPLEPLRAVRRPFPRLRYEEAIGLLNTKGVAAKWGDDFGGDEETLLADAFDRPVFVHRYPVECKAFYMQPDPEDPRVVLGVDCLAPEGYGEIAGGGQRIHDLALLDRRLAEHSLPREAFEWYRDLRRYGSVPHAGFGLGLERLVSWICKLPHVRETIPFPRMLYRIYP
jgi:asparaginyl-tRNA synthetase